MRLTATVFLTALTLAACAQVETSGPLPPPGRVMGNSVTEADAGKTVTLTVGERLSVELQGIASAGYVWEPAEVPSFLSKGDVLSGPVDKRQTQPGFAGGNNWDVHLFKADAAGQGPLVMHLRRPWESKEPPTRTFSIRVVVR